MVDDTNNQYFESLSDEYNVNTFLSETHITIKSKVFEILILIYRHNPDRMKGSNG